MRPISALLSISVIASSSAHFPVKGADEAKVTRAVKRGAEYLDAQFAKAAGEDSYGVGAPALAGIALLEAGVKPDSPGLASIVKALRDEALAQTQTYQVALCILFFDKLAEKTGAADDEGIIQLLGIRLYAGLNASGGWSYSTWDGITQQELVRLRNALMKNELTTRPNKPAEKPAANPSDDGFLKPTRVPTPSIPDAQLVPEAGREWAKVQRALKAQGRNQAPMDDNSNTQFGLIGLWVAARHGVHASDAFALIEARFLRTQNREDSGWNYGMLGKRGGGNSTPSMTCAGLLGLAVGAGSRHQLAADVARKPEPPKPVDGDPFSNPGSPAVIAKPVAAPSMGHKKQADAALAVLGQFLAASKPKAPAGRAGEPANLDDLRNSAGMGNAFYLLWSVERVAVAYGLDTLGAVDWYAWGSDYLLPGQRADGSWEPVKYGSVVNTSLALLFLTKSNSVRELAGRIKGGAAANKSELRTSPMAKAPALAPTVNEEAKADPKVEPKVEHKSALPAPLAPGVQAPIELTEGEKIASALMSSSDGEWAGKLSEARDAKGAKWTRGLALACGRLEPERKRQAREALADRLTRMTSMSLREMFEARDAELRRGACLAAGMKDDRLLIPGVIGRITDPSEAVVRAARESLKSIGHVDHGPPNGADPDAKAQAAALWRKWFESLPK